MKSVNKRILSAVCALLIIAASLGITACKGTPFTGGSLKNGKVWEEYSVKIASGKKNVFYELSYDDIEEGEMPLPQGLELDQDGTISGTPETAVTKTFTVIEQALSGDDYREAQFTLTIERGAITYAAKPLPDATTEEGYSENLGYATGAGDIKYAVKTGDTLPEGLALEDTGRLHGFPEEADERAEFTIVASTEHCDPAEATFVLKIEEGDFEYLGHIEYDSFDIPNGETGSHYRANLGTARGVRGITYAFRSSGGASLPSGLSIDEYGVLEGTPKGATYTRLYFYVVASAPGYASVQKEFNITVLDPYEETNKYEAEYINVTGLRGYGLSGNVTGTQLIQNVFPKASNGRVLGFLHGEITFKFEFTSDKASTGKLLVCAGTEIPGGTTFTSTESDQTKQPMTIKVNGTALPYGTFTIVENGTYANTVFQSFILTPDINIKAGSNIIEFSILPVRPEGEGTSLADGPIMDYIQINNSDAKLGWRPAKSNIK